MPGFYVSNSNCDVELHDLYPKRCLAEKITTGSFVAKRDTLNKFIDDKAFFWNEKYLVITEGYLLNKQELFTQYKAHTVAELAIKLYEGGGVETFFNAFRGSFSGAFYDKNADKWLIYTNHTGENPVFYGLFGDVFYAASQATYLLDALKKSGEELHLDEDGAYQMLTFGFMERDNTYAKEIKRLRGGTYLRVEHGKAEVREYHMFHKHPERFAGKSEAEIIDALDAAFRHAVELEYQKDEEYGYTHLSDMSGGLDSRMSAWVAHEIKPRHIQLLTYCRANYLDELIAKQIAYYWKDELLVKPLDDLSFIYDIDEITAMTGGSSLYMGITGGKRMLESLNADMFGLEHTGMIGDVVIGSFYNEPTDKDSRKPNGLYSERLSKRIEEKSIKYEQSTFDDHETYLIYVRGIQGAANSYLIRKHYTEVAAPFMDVDFLQFCLDVPAEMRIGHNLYYKWILSKYPDAARFKWEKIGGKITEPRSLTRLRKVVLKGPGKLLRMLGKNSLIASGMNPIDYWLDRDENAQGYLDAYFDETFRSFQKLASEQLCADLKALYDTGNSSEKSMALTVLSAAKLYFNANFA